MNRRKFIYFLGASAALLTATNVLKTKANADETKKKGEWDLTDAEWKARLTEEQYQVLRHEATERSFSSPLYTEKRKGTYVCAGCELPLFSSEAKYESGTGWPSFFQPLDGAIDTKRDFKLILPRTEYHCKRCGGHQGHVFNDGPEPTGQRWCNNGVALKFIPEGV